MIDIRDTWRGRMAIAPLLRSAAEIIFPFRQLKKSKLAVLRQLTFLAAFLYCIILV